jgi:hypothetical protein
MFARDKTVSRCAFQIRRPSEELDVSPRLRLASVRRVASADARGRLFHSNQLHHLRKGTILKLAGNEPLLLVA